MSEQMTTFDKAARKAAEEINDGLCFTCTGEEQRKTDADCITKHFQPLADLNAKLVELAKVTDNINTGLLSFRSKDKHYGKVQEIVDMQTRQLELLADPTVAAAIKEIDA